MPGKSVRYHTAPPAASQSLLLVKDGETIRGQQPIANLFTSPLVIGLVLAAAIAIPIAVNNSSKSNSSP